MRLMLLYALKIFYQMLHIVIFLFLSVQPIDHLIRVDSNESILHKSVDAKLLKPEGQMLQYFRFVDEIVLHQISTRVVSGHGVAMENVMSFDFQTISVLEQTGDYVFVDLFDDSFEEYVVAVDPDWLFRHYPGLLNLHR